MRNRTEMASRNRPARRDGKFANWMATFGDEGGALVELALVMTFLFPPVLIGIVQAASLVHDSIEVSNAAHTGAAYAAQFYITSNDTALPTQAQVTSAAQSDVPNLTSFTAPMAIGCGAGAATAGNAMPACAAGVLPYVQVTASATVVPLIGKPVNMRTTATIPLVN